ncbi:acyl-CoA dehydrogenase family protein [Pannus brasiliensis CCIBt3594]|uniref:Acyl-CoA dehydrogenase family protein n=1 Tax=Pannus brasiliensis CCIBt3594 TaxID=1427578 RepID=A0AAW9QF60_9CHRO
MMNHDLLAQKIAREVDELFGKFIQEEINPQVLERDEKGICLSAEILDRACKLGMTSYPIPRELGGGGASLLEWGLMLERVGYLCQDLSFPFVISLRGSVMKMIYKTGRQDLIDRYLKPMIAGDRVPAFAYTDGADPFSFKTVAKDTDGGYLLTGKKLFTTGGANANTLMTYARYQKNGFDDLKVLLVDRNWPGVEVIPLPMAGWRAAGISTIHFHDVYVPEEAVMVATDGLSHVQEFLNARRAILVSPVLGRMQAILEDCTRYLGGSIRYNRPLTVMQGVQAEIGRMYKLVETSRAIVYRALENQSIERDDPLWDPITSLAKSYTTDSAIQLVLTAQRVLGGAGQLRTNHYERYLRDFCGLIPGGGAQGTLDVDLGVAVISRYEA